MIADMKWFRFKLPLTAPIVVGADKIFNREGLIVRLETEEGDVGWGEAAPLNGFYGWLSIDDLIAAAAEIDAVQIPDYLDNVLSSMAAPSIDFALSSAMAWIDRCRQESSGLLAETIKTVRLIGLEDSLEEVTSTGSENDVVKVKVGQDGEKDARRINEVCSYLSDSVAIRMDANRRWAFDEAVQFVSKIDANRIQFFEEPIADASRFVEFAETTGLVVAADETLQEKQSVEEIERLSDSVGIFVIKPTMIGSLERCCALETMMQNKGKTVVYSSAYESGVGMLGILNLIGRQQNDLSPGIGTYSRIEDDVLTQRLPIEGPAIAPGINLSEINLDMELLDRVA